MIILHADADDSFRKTARTPFIRRTHHNISRGKHHTRRPPCILLSQYQIHGWLDVDLNFDSRSRDIPFRQPPAFSSLIWLSRILVPLVSRCRSQNGHLSIVAPSLFRSSLEECSPPRVPYRGGAMANHRLVSLAENPSKDVIIPCQSVIDASGGESHPSANMGLLHLKYRPRDRLHLACRQAPTWYPGLTQL